MAMGVELWLAYPYAEWAKHAPEEAPRLTDPLPVEERVLNDSHQEGNPYHEWEQRFREWAVPHGPALRGAWLECLKDCNLEWGGAGGGKRGRVDAGGRYELVDGTESKPFVLTTPSLWMMTDRQPAVRPIGVPLTGSYFPVFLDHRPDGGPAGVGNPFDVAEWAASGRLKIARWKVSQVLPWMAAARLLAVLMHY